MKASQLDSMKRIQEEIENERQTSLQMIEEKQASLPKLESELFELEQKYKKCQSVDKLRKKLHILIQEFTWTVVINCEKTLDSAKKEEQLLLTKKEKSEKKVQEAENSYNQTNIAFEAIKENLSAMHANSKESGAQIEKANEHLISCANNYKGVQTEIKKSNFNLERKNKELKELTETMEKEKNNEEKDYEEERAQKELKINTIKQEFAQSQEVERFKYRDNKMYESAIDQAYKQMNDKNFDIKNSQRYINNLNQDIETLNKSTRDRIHRFGANMYELDRAVRQCFQQGRFKKMPKGPIGMFVELKDHKYSIAVEQCLGQLMTAFICENYDDEKIMHQLINKFIQKHKPRVIVMDYSSNLYEISKYVILEINNGK
jgi:chromosome segregation ATPase